MPGFKQCGPLGLNLESLPIDKGTSPLAAMPSPSNFTLLSPENSHLDFLSVSSGSPPWSFKISEEGLNLLKSIEKLYLKPYDDQTGQTIDKWVRGATIGYGHLIKKDDWFKFKNGLTEAEASDLFLVDLSPFIRGISLYVFANLTQNQFDALVIFAFNIGLQRFRDCSVVKLINNPKAVTPYKNLEAAWKALCMSQGVFNQGVANRRNCEWKIYTLGCYERW